MAILEHRPFRRNSSCMLEPQRFLSIVGERKAEYNDTETSNTKKAVIAEEVLQKVLDADGARFLRLVRKGERVRDSVWVEAPRSVALEKVSIRFGCRPE